MGIGGKNMTKNETENIEAGNTPNDQIEYIPIDRIVPHPLCDTGIRNDEEFDQLVEDIRMHGLNQAIVVRPKGGKFELGIGHTRWRAFQELTELGEQGYGKIKAEIRHIEDDAEWAEIVVTDNLRRTNYSQIQLEELTYLLWEEGSKSGRYQKHEDLAKVMQCTDTWIRNRIEARELRLKVQEKYPNVELDNISTQSMLDAKKIMEDRGDIGFRDYAKLLDLANQEKARPNRIKNMATTLPQWSEELRKKVLFDGTSFGSIEFELKNKANNTKPKPKKKTSIKSMIETENPKFIIETYEALSKHLKNYLTTISEREQDTAFRYIKVMTVLLCEQLLDHNWINEIHFKQISDEILEVNISPYNYDGGKDLQKLGRFLGTHAEELENKRMEKVTSDSDPPKHPTNKEGQ